MTVWLFSSKGIEHIKTACERLVWGFWDRDAGEKMKKNWRSFIRAYNKIKPFDIAVFQERDTGGIHAIGIVKKVGYDDQTPVWDMEMNQKKVLFPWRVYFSMMLFYKDPILNRFIKISDYIDGYGLGEFPSHEFPEVLSKLKSMSGLEVQLDVGEE